MSNERDDQAEQPPPADQSDHPWELHFPAGRTGAGFLTAQFTDRGNVCITLDSRIARLLAILRDARAVDAARLPRAAQGWRSKAELARLLAEDSGYTVNETTVTAYLSKLAVTLRKVISSLDGAIPAKITNRLRGELIERQRGLGARLADGVALAIRDWSDQTTSTGSTSSGVTPTGVTPTGSTSAASSGAE